MDPIAIINGVMQVIGAVTTLEPVVVKAVQDFSGIFAGGAQPTDAELTAHIDALISRVQSQSAQIQALDE